ncbi:Hint domain-containing protein [Phaeobacter sp.]|uniref:Hint domain-containing protein n=1 Tax=Phaeobacter sp. TaxID=1902409 RepID=UPI0025FD5CFB|nr:Hint domain-containing protein [Phaeobacter sp.]
MQNLILNGTFNSGSAFWTGTDIEASYREGAYLGNGSSNRVSEIDGNGSATTVMQQTFTVTDPVSTEVTLDVALRNAALGQAGIDGFVMEVLDSSGNVISGMTVLPTTNSFTQVTLAVDFTDAGDYTLRFTEIGNNDSLGAIIDNVAIMVCYCGGTEIDTPSGPRKIETLRAGDLVSTENGPRPVRWIGRSNLTAQDLEQHDKLRPVCISAGALGHGVPNAPLRVSRQHRMVVRSQVAQRMFGAAEVMVPAIRLVSLPGIALAETAQAVSYFHLVFDDHEIIRANGAPSESLLLTAQSLRALSPAAQDELRTLFPDLTDRFAGDCDSARLIPARNRQKRLIERLQKNHQPVVDTR